MKKPKLVIITGRPGSGKTTLAKKLGELIYLPVVSRDEIKEGYVNTFNVKHDKLSEDTNKVVTEIFFKNIDFLLSNNISIITEAAFQYKVWEPKITEFTKQADVILIICDVEAQIAAKRHLQRGLDDSKREFYHGDNRVVHYKKTGEFLPAGDWEEPSVDTTTIKVSTLDGYDPAIEEIAKQIFE